MTKKILAITGSFFLTATLITAAAVVVTWGAVQPMDTHPLTHVFGMVFGISAATAAVIGGCCLIVYAFETDFDKNYR